VIDALLIEFDRGLRTVFLSAPTQRPMPGEALADGTLSPDERRHAAALMRVNHAGEICAQALYRGQAMTCRTENLRVELVQAGVEEAEHLNWTERRLGELGGRKSLLNPFWYAASWSLGAVAGRIGDSWSLGFLAETERQVEVHLDRHLASLPAVDARSRAILTQMKADERQHADHARTLGARRLPAPARVLMSATARLMTATARFV
jgi:ubiquinone biosynthesis monooxygenase Coq7